MTRVELIARIAERTGLDPKVYPISRVLDALLAIVQEELMARRSVRLTRFGKFEVITRKASRRKNPQTGDIQEIPSRLAVAFRCSDILKRRLNGL